MLSFKIVSGFVHQSTMNTIFISICLLAAISITPNDAHNYKGWVANAIRDASDVANHITELGQKYSLSRDEISPKVNAVYSARNDVLKNLETCLNSWKPYYGSWVASFEPLNEGDLVKCWKRVEAPFRTNIDKLQEGAEILFQYYNWKNDMINEMSQLEDFVRSLSKKYNLAENDMAPEMKEFLSLKKKTLGSLEFCLKLTDKQSISTADLSTLKISEVANCHSRITNRLRTEGKILKEKTNVLFKYDGCIKYWNISISESKDFIRKLGEKYGLNEDDIIPKINELSFLKRHFLESLETCMNLTELSSSAMAKYNYYYLESTDSKQLDQCLKDLENPFKNAVEIVKKGAETLFIHQRSVSNVHTFTLESENFIRKLTNKYTLTQDDMAPRMKELSFLKRQVLRDLERCFNFWFIKQSGRGFQDQHELERCLERVKEPFDYAVNVVENEAELSSKTDCTFLYEVRWMNNFVASCTDPLIRDAMNRRAVDCVYFELSNSVINSIEKQVLDTTVLHTMNDCHTEKFSQLLPKFIHWKTMLWTKLRSDSINILNNIASKNNKCLTKNIEKELLNLHSWNQGIVKELYDYIQTQKREYEEC